MAKPLITANQVTSIRLLLLPVGSWLLYQGTPGQVIAIFFMTLVGCTDFVDGWLARKYGPTVLGALMDPIADKVFIAVVFLPLMDPALDRQFLPAYQVGLLLLREFLITGLRSAYERRNVQLKTSMLGKIKTWAQMVGAGVVCLLGIAPRHVMLLLFGLATFLPFVAMAIRYGLTRRGWPGALVFSVWWAIIGACYLVVSPRLCCDLLMLSVLGITWLSAWGYVSEALPFFARRRDRGTARPRPLDAGDWARIAGGVAVPVLLVWGLSRGLSSLALIMIASLEMAVGGLDNLLCHHKAESPPIQWAGRVGLVAVLLGLAVAASVPGNGLAPVGLTPFRLAVAACAASLIGTLIEFYRGRSYFLDEKLQSEPL